MNLTEAKKQIDKTGEVFLTLTNDTDGLVFIGQVDKMTTKDGRVKLVWKLPAATHTSAFNYAAIHNKKTTFTYESIFPVRLDTGLKKYQVEWDV